MVGKWLEYSSQCPQYWVLSTPWPAGFGMGFGGMARRNGCCSDEGNTRNILVSQMCNSGGDIPAVSPIHISPSM